MDNFLGITYGIIFGILGALFIIPIWAMGGVARRNALGCLGGFLTFLIIEIPIWIEFPIMISVLLANRAPNGTGTKTLYFVFVVSLITLISIDAVTKFRIIWENLWKR